MSEIYRKLARGDSETKIRATYELTPEDIRGDPRIIGELRNNLNTSNDDLLEITLMRIGIRAHDVDSLQNIIKISREHSSDLVKSAAVFAMSSIATEHSACRSLVVSHLRFLLEDADAELSLIINRELGSLNGAI